MRCALAFARGSVLVRVPERPTFILNCSHTLLQMLRRFRKPRLAIAGATGAVGQELLRILEEREFPVEQLKLLASARSAGKEMTFRGETLGVEELRESSFSDVDIALFSAGGSQSKR